MNHRPQVRGPVPEKRPQEALGSQARKPPAQHAGKLGSLRGREKASACICKPFFGRTVCASTTGETPALLRGQILQSHGQDAALPLASLAEDFPRFGVTAQEGAGCRSVGEVPGAFLASALLLPFLPDLGTQGLPGEGLVSCGFHTAKELQQ